MDKLEVISEVLKWIDEKDITTFTTLVIYSKEYKYNEWFKIVVENAQFFKIVIEEQKEFLTEHGLLKS